MGPAPLHSPLQSPQEPHPSPANHAGGGGHPEYGADESVCVCV